MCCNMHKRIVYVKNNCIEQPNKHLRAGSLELADGDELKNSSGLSVF